MPLPHFPRLETASPEGETLTIERLDDGTSTGDGFRVLLYNDDHTPIDAVVEQIIKATGCTEAQAAQITLEAHLKGRAVCFRGAREKCQRVTKILREIRLQCEVDCD